MSAGSRALEAVIRMRDEASRTLRQVRDATRALQNQTNSTSQAQERLQEQFRKVSNAAKIAGAGIVTGIGAGLVSASKAGAEFETAMTKTSTMFGDTKVDTENLNNKVLELSKNTGIAASSIGESLYNALSSGIPVTKDMGSAMDFMTKNAKLSKAGFTDIDTALTATAKVLNAYKMDVSETDRVHKVMMQTQNKGITTVGELGATLAQVTPTASAMSFSFEQVGASLANMTAQGTPTAQATTQLNSLLAELGKTGTVANKSLLSATKGTKYAGKSFKELMQAGVPLNKILNLMDGSAKKNKKSLIDMFGSIEAGKAALALSDQNSEQYTNNLKAMSTQADVVSSAYAKMSNTLESKVGILKESFKNLGIEIYSKLKEPLKNAAETGIQCLQDLNNQFSNGSLKEGVSQIAQSFGDLTSTIIKIATKSLPPLIKSLSWILKNGSTIASIFVSIKAAAIMTGAVKSIVALKNAWIAAKVAVRVYMIGMAEAGTVLSAFQILVGVLTTNMTIAQARTMLLAKASLLLGGPIGIAVIAVTALVAGLVVLWNTNKGFRDFVINAWNKIKETATKVWGGICNFFTQTIPQAWNDLCTSFSNTGQWFGELWNNIKQAFVNGWNAIVAFFTQTIPMWINSIGIWFNQLPTKIGYALGFTLGKIIAWYISCYTYIFTNIPIWINTVATFFAQLPNKIWVWLVSTVQKIDQWGIAMLTSAQIYTSMIINNIVTFFTTLPGRIWTWLTNTVQKIVTWGSQMATKGKEGAKKLINTVVDTLKSLPQKVMDIGKNVVKGLWKGITGAGDWLKGKVGDFAKGVIDGFKNGFGVHSPSWKLRDLVGRFLPLGIWEGIKVELPSLKSNIDNVVSNLTQRMYKPQEIEESDYTSKYKEAITQRTQQNTINKTDSKTTNNKESNNITININWGGVTVKEEADMTKLTKMLVNEIKLNLAGGV
ncbi:phage tail tape measure protein [Clostridioides difficile]|uniref:phage tail tape measure protein n=2 Tax=Clostridioides difficile TaxID=1496 RepID=UPI00038C8111|nr:phage tail tape measure protein [Clostridioides difficile]EQJ20260.1 phage tail tape measure protein, TP901 family, core region [Clostridioides difficile P13]ERM52275.1 phage tail tape measure protein, TP901 family, core region [Clostridioides difficile P68]MBH7250627.1 phage tail tape measure protein [Clostridioides difficile]MBJ8544390.1 phage tail tape measure protein [Clostridioides difficile]MBJ8569502.1 phage tail tape measure protein [Clostridioides difficile]